MLRGFPFFSYYLIPLVSAILWLACILSLLIHWCTTGYPIYTTFQHGQTIAYISDVGAEDWKPVFVGVGTASVVIFDLAFLAERWLRHNGRLTRNTTTGQKILAGFSIAFAFIGALGLILLTIFDVKRHKTQHDIFLALFIGGYVVSAIFICAEYQRLGVLFREYRILRLSFWMKLFFIVVEIALAIAFGVLNRSKMWNAAACVEWAIAFVYTFWVLSFVVDFLPVVDEKWRGRTREY